MKKITISKCEECPHKDHGGGFGQIAYIPKCGMLGNKTIPYTKHVSGSMIVAEAVDEIPEWCPLDDN